MPESFVLRGKMAEFVGHVLTNNRGKIILKAIEVRARRRFRTVHRRRDKLGRAAFAPGNEGMKP